METMPYQIPWPINVVIMAGGKGTRLKSITEKKHKSLVEIGGKPIIHHLVDHLVSFGCSSICLSVGHLSDQITDLFEDGSTLGISISYIYETSPMGSVGALALKNDWEHDYFMVLNGDIFTNFNIKGFINDFFLKKADLAILTFLNHIDIPWGVLTINSDGEITNLAEKPTYSIQISTGIYLFNRRILKLLPLSGPMEGWELIQSALKNGCKVISIPMNDGYWIDIGTPESLQKAQEMTSLIR